MELGRNGDTVFFVALAAGAITSGWWVRRTAADLANIFNDCHKSKKLCQSELFIINNAIS